MFYIGYNKLAQMKGELYTMPNFNMLYYNTTIHELMEDERRQEELEKLKKKREQMRSNIMSERDVRTVEGNTDFIEQTKS